MKQKRNKIGLKLLLAATLLIVCTGATAYAVARDTSLALYNKGLLSKEAQAQILAVDGTVLSETGMQATHSDIPQHVKSAFITIEDKRFYSHSGVDYKRLLGAAVSNIKSGTKKEGGSTISQQLIKNTHLSAEKSYKRKIKEYFLARQMEKDYSKQEILAMYLNDVYFGNGIYGIADASYRFFNKHYTKLNLQEGALLAAVINSPVRYSPTSNPKRATDRRNLVLDQMHKQGIITEEQYTAAAAAPLNITTTQADTIRSVLPSIIREEAVRLVGERLSNATIYSTIDIDKQRTLEAIMEKKKYLIKTNGCLPDRQGLIINNKTGGIEAYYSNSKLAFKARRQPASTIKPILVFAPALEKGIISPATTIVDEKISLNGYSPKNFDGKYHGNVTARQSLSGSLNVPAVKLLDAVGIENAKTFAKNAGVRFERSDSGYALALGGMSRGITLVENANIYQAIASSGNLYKCGLIDKIVLSSGEVAYERKANAVKIMRDDTAYLLTDMLKDSVLHGTSYKLKNLGFDIAAKTGTAGSSRGNTDAYSISYTTEHTVAVWHGDLGGKRLLNLRVTGGGIVSAQNREVVAKIYSKKTPKKFEMPKSVAAFTIDADAQKNGRIVQADFMSKNTTKEVFSIYNPPKAIKRTKPYQQWQPQSLPQNTQPQKPKSPLAHLKKLFMFW